MPNKKKLFSEEETIEILKFYETNSLCKTCDKFHIGPPRLREILRENNVEVRNVSKSNIISHKNRNEEYRQTVNVTYDDVYDYYVIQAHNLEDTINYFKGLGIRNFVIEEFLNQIHKTQDQINESKIRKCREKFGFDWASQHPDIAKVQEENKNKTLKEKYGVTNSYQLANRRKYICDGYVFDSFPELALWKYAKDNNEEIEREPIVLYYRFNGKIHKCLPDFKYKGKLVELKGDHLIDSDTLMLKNPYIEDTFENRRLLELKSWVLHWNDVEIWTESKYNYYIDWFNQYYNKEDFRYKKGE